LLHREFGHNYLPILIAKNNDKKFRQIGLESVHQQSTELAKKYVAHVTSAVKGLVQ
jgi:FKBP12-rapamycin complex-associated protein